jgi:hypothetical protein
MYCRINQYMLYNNILVPEQYVFRKCISTEDAAFKLTDSVLKFIEQGKYVGLIFLISKSFWLCKSWLLLSKLHFYGIQGTVFKWLRSYLTDRKQRVIIKSPKCTQNFFSNWETIKHGFLQGSNLGLLLFMICI